MKKTITTILILSFITAFIPPEPKYKVELTLDKWQNTVNLIEQTKNAIKNSDLPTKYSLPLMDSLTLFENEITAQVRTQLSDTSKQKK